MESLLQTAQPQLSDIELVRRYALGAAHAANIVRAHVERGPVDVKTAKEIEAWLGFIATASDQAHAAIAAHRAPRLVKSAPPRGPRPKRSRQRTVNALEVVASVGLPYDELEAVVCNLLLAQEQNGERGHDA